MNYLVAVLFFLVGVGFCLVGLTQLYMAGVAWMVGTRAFEMSNWELAKMGAELAAFGVGIGVLGLWVGK